MKKMPDGDIDDPGPKFDPGPPLSPADKLLVWLERQTRNGKPRLVRVPMILQAQDGVFALRGARIGGAADAIAVYANDSRLGIGLGDHARQHCTGQSKCAFWVHGYYRGKDGGELRFDVVTMESHIPPEAIGGADHAAVEGESGN